MPVYYFFEGNSLDSVINYSWFIYIQYKLTSFSLATTGNFTSPIEMEMSQTGFSAHTSEVSKIIFFILDEIH